MVVCDCENLDRRRRMVMKIVREDWNLRQWYDWLASMGLEVGRDYKWAWLDNNWAIEFHDQRVETMIRLKARLD